METIQQIERAIGKIAQKFPYSEEDNVLTDIHVRINAESGELLAFDDDDNELNRCVIDKWINSTDEEFYNNAAHILRDIFHKNAKIIDGMGILKPFSIVLEDEDCEHIGEIYVADDDTVIVGGDLMPGLDGDLDKFLEELNL